MSDVSPLIDAALAPSPLPGYEKFLESFDRYPSGNLSILYSLDALDVAVIAVYFGILFLLAIYGAYRLKIVYQFLRNVGNAPKPERRFAETELPRITVQLPLFNEMYVAERIIDACSALDYPGHLLEIQVL